MATEIVGRGSYPKDAKTGLTLPLSKSLGSQDLALHRAKVAFELEVLAKKVDRFGWDRDRGTPAQDRLITDWMKVLQDYPIEEVQAACQKAIIADPKNCPNEGHIVRIITKQRGLSILGISKQEPEAPKEEATPESRARVAAMVAEIGAGKRIGGKP